MGELPSPPPVDRASRRIVFGCLLGVLLLAGTAGLGLRALARVSASQHWVTHTVEVQLQAERLRTDVRGLGRAVLDGLASGSAMAQVLRDWQRPIAADLDWLAALVADNPAQSERLAQLRPLIEDHLLRLRDLSAGDVAQLVARRARIAQIEGRIDAFAEQESRLLRTRQAALGESLRLQAVAIVVLGALATSVLLLTVARLLRVSRERAQAQAEAEHQAGAVMQLNQSLERQVLRRTQWLQRIAAAQQLRSAASRLLMEAVEAPDDEPVLQAWRQCALDSGLVTGVTIRRPGRTTLGDDAPSQPGARKRSLPYGFGELRWTLPAELANAGDAATGAADERAVEMVDDLGVWLELRRQRDTRRATERERDERGERLQALARQLLEVEENERRALARELHDDFGQRLAALKMNLQLARGAMPGAPATLSDGIAIVEGCIVQVRERAFSLRPRQLDELGLGAALRGHVEQQARLAGIEARVLVELDGWTPPPHAAGQVFRIVQEALRNAIGHGRPQAVSVQLQRTGEALLLRIADDGRGLDAGRGRAGMGLLNMRERTELLGGTFDIRPADGGGTEVLCRWPLQAMAAAEEPTV